MKIDIEKIRPQIAEIAEKRDLLFVILYGSQATGKTNDESDVDVAVLGKKPISFNELIDLNGEFADVFKVKEIDVKSLHNASPFFLYQVMLNGILLYGDEHKFNIFKLYAIRSFQESAEIRRLRDAIMKKRGEHLKEVYAK